MGGYLNGIVVYEDEVSALKLMSEELSRYHQVFAKAAVENGGLGVIIRVNGVDVGSAIGYTAEGSMLTVGVIYYVYIRRSYRGSGFGKVLVASMEELLEGKGSRVYVASTTRDNIESQRLFKSLGYRVLEWSIAESELGYDVVEALEAIACMYDDDIIMVKPYSRSLLSKLRRLDYRSLWFNICYKPWLDYRSYTSVKL
jgi:ribosomal protein S18 acetylase RimI-like enzyme